MAACFSGQISIVCLMIDKGADINISHYRYGCALSVAALKGRKRLVELLLANGADVNQYAGYYEWPLASAAYGGHVAIARMLLEKGANPNPPMKKKFKSVVETAKAGYNSEEMITLLELSAKMQNE
ncbi:ankyrin [Lepidopterella palustris CBS 459.81]|uniref:Ankyrin n=1 Tax=Lepidopterella palustris CBS 459.81 TaxID=1314670 RepID=A0A8E2DXE6_9PEZI|nr:ankyrin [Lepidopterella palustris CBS 459.81]